MLYSILKSDALSERFVHWDVFRGVETPGLNPLSLRDNDRPPKDHVPSGPARISHAPVRNARRAPKAYVFSVIGRLVVKFLQVFIFCWLPANGVR